jgi:hypothetical protein
VSGFLRIGTITILSAFFLSVPDDSIGQDMKAKVCRLDTKGVPLSRGWIATQKLEPLVAGGSLAGNTFD